MAEILKAGRVRVAAASASEVSAANFAGAIATFKEYTRGNIDSMTKLATNRISVSV
jgi:hypothetical protein